MDCWTTRYTAGTDRRHCQRICHTRIKYGSHDRENGSAEAGLIPSSRPLKAIDTCRHRQTQVQIVATTSRIHENSPCEFVPGGCGSGGCALSPKPTPPTDQQHPDNPALSRPHTPPPNKPITPPLFLPYNHPRNYVPRQPWIATDYGKGSDK